MLVTFLSYIHVACVMQMFAAEEASAGYSARQQKLHQHWQKLQSQLLLAEDAGREYHMSDSSRREATEKPTLRPAATVRQTKENSRKL